MRAQRLLNYFSTNNGGILPYVLLSDGNRSPCGALLAVTDCGGVGYACKTTSHSLGGLTVGQKGKLFTHLNVREDAMELYGFTTESERNCFEMLIGISGVGPEGRAVHSVFQHTGGIGNGHYNRVKRRR